MTNKNPNYRETDEGYEHVGGRRKGNADYFARPMPPVRDNEGRPLTKGGRVDWNRWAEELKERKGR